MRSIDARRDRVNELYRLRTKINDEIAVIEDEIAEEIRAMRRAQKAAGRVGITSSPRRPTAVCGTDGGYYRHLRTLKESACPACKLAHRAAERERAERRGAA